MRSCLSRVLFFVAIAEFVLLCMVHLTTFFVAEWKYDYFDTVFLLVVSGVLTFFPAQIFEQIRTGKYLINTIWPVHFFRSMPWKGRIAVLLVFGYFLYNIRNFIPAISGDEIAMIRYMTGFVMLFVFVAAMYYRYVLPKGTSPNQTPG